MPSTVDTPIVGVKDSSSCHTTCKQYVDLHANYFIRLPLVDKACQNLFTLFS